MSQGLIALVFENRHSRYFRVALNLANLRRRERIKRKEAASFMTTPQSFSAKEVSQVTGFSIRIVQQYARLRVIPGGF